MVQSVLNPRLEKQFQMLLDDPTNTLLKPTGGLKGAASDSSGMDSVPQPMWGKNSATDECASVVFVILH